MDLCSISTIKYIQKVFGFKNAKSLGQNFLLDSDVIKAMADAAGLGSDDLAIEIGPGIGVLTHEIAKRAGKVIAVEIDKALLPVLQYTLAEHNNVEVINQDILKTDLGKLIAENLPISENLPMEINQSEGSEIDSVSDGNKNTVKRNHVKILGNLPYYITTPIITELLENHVPAKSITIMMQKEVAERIVADPGSKTYGAISVMVQYYCQVEKVIEVPRDSFFPAPKVDSEVLNLIIRDEPAVKVRDQSLFFRLVKAGFGQRRKTLSNSLTGTGIEKERILDALKQTGIDGTRRAETLSLEEFAALTEALIQV